VRARRPYRSWNNYQDIVKSISHPYITQYNHKIVEVLELSFLHHLRRLFLPIKRNKKASHLTHNNLITETIFHKTCYWFNIISMHLHSCSIMLLPPV
jgi:hypothetical protein